MIKHFRDLPLWAKCGLVFAASYFLIIILLVLAVFSGIGDPKNDIFVWLLIYSLVPAAWLLGKAGITVTISRSLVELIIINLSFSFLIGGIVGIIAGKIKLIVQQINKKRTR